MSELSFERFVRPARSTCTLALSVLMLFAAGAAIASDNDDEGENDSYAIGLWGDLPYSDLQAQVGVPNLIADMNAQRLKFTVHDGDLKAGNAIAGSATPTTCSNALYAQSLALFNSLKAPASIPGLRPAPK